MQALAIDGARRSEGVHQVAIAIATSCGQMAFGCQLRKLYQYMVDSVRFKRDTHGIEHIRRPEQLVHEIETHGMTAADCDDLATLAAAIGMALGMRMGFAVDGSRRSGPLEHVYPVAWLGGQWVPMDAQHRVGFGRWPEAARRKIWAVEEPAV